MNEEEYIIHDETSHVASTSKPACKGDNHVWVESEPVLNMKQTKFKSETLNRVCLECGRVEKVTRNHYKKNSYDDIYHMYHETQKYKVRSYTQGKD